MNSAGYGAPPREIAIAMPGFFNGDPMTTRNLTIEYLPLLKLKKWPRNPKEHDCEKARIFTSR